MKITDANVTHTPWPLLPEAVTCAEAGRGTALWPCRPQASSPPPGAQPGVEASGMCTVVSIPALDLGGPSTPHGTSLWMQMEAGRGWGGPGKPTRSAHTPAFPPSPPFCPLTPPKPGREGAHVHQHSLGNLLSKSYAGANILPTIGPSFQSADASIHLNCPGRRGAGWEAGPGQCLVCLSAKDLRLGEMPGPRPTRALIWLDPEPWFLLAVVQA